MAGSPFTPPSRATSAFHLFFVAALVAAAFAGGLAARPVRAASSALKPDSPACSNTITVTNGNDSGAGSLRQAVADLCDSGTITFATNTTVTLASQIVLDKLVTIDGQDKRVTISGNDQTRIFYVDRLPAGKNIYLNRLTLAHGETAGGGGAIEVHGNLSIEACLFAHNAAALDGGAIYVLEPGFVTVTNSTFAANTAGHDGGAALTDGAYLALYNVTITGNSGSPTGGVSQVGSTGEADIRHSIVAAQTLGANCSFGEWPADSDNNLTDTGSCTYNGASAGFTTSSSILLGALGDYGGVSQTIPLLPGSAAINFGSDCATGADQRGFPRVGVCDVGAFESQGFNLAVTGGNNQSVALNTTFATPLSVSVTPKNAAEPVNGGQVTFTAPGSGASAALSGSPATIGGGSASVTATANGVCGPYGVTASARGAANATGNMTNTGPSSSVVTSSADGGAGSLRQAIANTCQNGTITFDGDRTVTLASRLLVDKSLTIDGSGLHVSLDGGGAAPLLKSTGSNVHLTHLTFANGASQDSNWPAGVQVSSGGVTISGCTFTNNLAAATVGGGALRIEVNAQATVVNSAFSGNRALEGAAIYNNGTLTLTNDSLWGNSPTDSGASVYGGGSATVNNVLVGGNANGSNCYYFNVASGSGNNLSSDTSCGSSFTQTSSLLVGTPGNYGGDTPTLPLLPGSAAIDAGNDAKCPVTDQRGYYRVRGCDVGAYEASFVLNKTGGDNQGAVTNSAFANPLEITVQPAFPTDPVDDGVVTFTPPVSGASAALGSTRVTVSGGKASVTATANGTTGSYQVQAAAQGADPVDFDLTNQLCSQVVTSNADDGAGSLRKAINDVCVGGTITFDGDKTITLASQLSIAKSLTIDATGHKVTVSGNNTVRDFNITSGTVTLRSLSINDGKSTVEGGAIYASANLTVDRCTFFRSTSTGGGAIYAAGGSLAVTNSTFASNTSSGAGGALYNYGAAVTLTNVTISGGSAGTYGGGIFTLTEAPAGVTTRALSSIVAGSTGGGNCGGKAFTATSANNLTDDSTCAGFSYAASVGLSGLANNGGDTQTMQLKNNSPAIDAGGATGGGTCPAIDQRGQARNDWACDAGAFELKQSDSNTVTTSVYEGATLTLGPTLVKVVVNSAGGCLTGISATRNDQNNQNTPDDLKTGRWWTITASPSNCTGFNVDLTLPVDFTPDTTGQDTVCRYTGSGEAWNCAWTASGTSSVTNYLTRAGVTAFSQWTVGHNTGPCSAPDRPAGLSIAAADPMTVNVTWSAADGANFYEVWTAENEPYFSVAGKLCSSAAPYTCSTTTDTAYSAEDLGNPAANHTYVVRGANNCGQI